MYTFCVIGYFYDYGSVINPRHLGKIAAKELLYRVAALVTVAKQSGHIRAVYVKGDNDVNYGKVVEVMALLRNAGVDDVGLITDSTSPTPTLTPY